MQLLARLLARVRSEPSRTPSVIVTLFGDAILPRGGEVWLGTLFEVFRTMGVGDGVVRTAMSRLAAEGWVERNRVGRNSFYRLSESAARISEEAGRVIYGPLPALGDARLRMAVEPFDREAMLRDGFVQLAPGVLVAAWLANLPFSAPSQGEGEKLEISGPVDATRRLAARLWPVAETAALYDRFNDMIDGASVPGEVDGLEALAARVLLVHEWRRVVLRDPRLPGALLPENWPAPAARTACAHLYAALLSASEHWLDACGLSSTGPLAPADAALRERFGE